MKEIRMVDLISQYHKIKNEVDKSIENVLLSSAFINGPDVKLFRTELAEYLQCRYVIPCANGTDALQVALMALDLNSGDEVVTTGFTFISTLEVIALLGLKPVLVDVDPRSFTISADQIEKAISPKTRVIIPVHIFGQCSHMEPISQLAGKYNLYIIEDTAQALGADYLFSDQTEKKAGTIGDIGCVSFFPSKNLGCYGDGGAIITNDSHLSDTLNSIVNHGMNIKYHHDRVGVNSRLDSLQAAILRIKLKHLDEYNRRRREAADFYDAALKNSEYLEIPYRTAYSTHIFHQYTLILKGINRKRFMEFLKSRGIPSMVYYPVPLHLQKAYSYLNHKPGDFPHTEYLCDHVVSLPMHTELEYDQKKYITDTIQEFVQNL